MALDLRDCTPFGSALPEPFLHDLIEHELTRRELLPGLSGQAGRQLEEDWDFLRRKLRALGGQGGDRRVVSHILEPLGQRLGYPVMERQGEVQTREGAEDGGWLLKDEAGHQLRVWALAVGQDLDAPNRRGRAYRFSPGRATQRVLLAMGERAGLLSNGEELRLLLCDPARPDSHLSISLEGSGGWRGARRAPDSFRLLKALAGPAGMAALPELTEAARLAQSTVTKQLREQARAAVEGFLQGVLEHPDNAVARAGWTDLDATARELWREGLVMVYRLLFVFKLEASPDPARAFSFATTSPWRNSYSPNLALAPLAQAVLLEGKDTGGYLEASLRALWRLFSHGVTSNEISVKALGGALFGEQATPLLDSLRWGDEAVAHLLVALLWTPGRRGEQPRHVHYGALDVEDLGRVYEALLELEPGISGQPMCRLRRAKLEVVVPLAQGAPYRATAAAVPADDEAEDDEDLQETEDEGEEEAPVRRGRGAGGAGTRVLFIEEIPAGRFHLRVGLGRKASGSYYTPHPFVRFLVQETLSPQLAQLSPRENPQPAAILGLKVLDPAMGSGHFLVEACRYLGEALYEACRLCDELAVQAEEEAERAGEGTARDELLARATALRGRVQALPDPEDALLAYLPSRVTEGESSGLSQRKAEALCRRLVAVHCLYGVDKNPLAAELAKLSLWLESYAEGLPLTFLDHRLLCGDSLTGPFVEHLLTLPKSGARLDDLFAQGLETRLRTTLATALARVGELEASVGTDVADLERKRLAKAALDAALQPFKTLAAAWSGGVMLGEAADDAAYQALAAAVAAGEDPAPLVTQRPRLIEMIALGAEGVPFELVLPEVFHPDGEGRKGFDAVLGNPPWDTLQPLAKEFFAAYDLRVLDAPTRRERAEVERRVQADPAVALAFQEFAATVDYAKRMIARLTSYVGHQAGGRSSGAVSDLWQVFAERGPQLLRRDGWVGLVLPSAFHANQSATGLREYYLNQMALACCFSFENRKLLFDIHRSFKFAAVVARRDEAGTQDFACGFYWHDLEQLFQPDAGLRYELEFVGRTGGSELTFLELRHQVDADTSACLYSSGILFQQGLERNSIRLGRELHMTDDSHRFTPSLDILPGGQDSRDPAVSTSLFTQGFLALHEGKTFHQFTDHWEAPPRYLVALTALTDKPGWLRPACHYRLAFRDIARSTDERTSIFSLLPPGVVCGNKAPCEREPENRPTHSTLTVLAVADSFTFDFALRLKVQATVNLFILNGCPFPALAALAERFLSHNALRLSCNHAGYAPLWEEQLGEAWREPTPPHTWPVLAGDETRWAVRAAIDAVVAQAYGLDRVQYAHVLSTFSHRSFPRAPELCLAAFDELQEIGLEAFCRRHDPYWDIPLNESLPRPVIDLPIPAATQQVAEPQADLFGFTGTAPAMRTRRRAARPEPARAQSPAAAAAGAAVPADAWVRLLALLEARGEITSTDAQAATGLDAAAVRPLLQRLVAEGLATQEGQRRGTRYRRVHG